MKPILIAGMMTLLPAGDQLLTTKCISPDGPPKILFEMHSGACLRGPLEFYGSNGELMFKLAADEYYPPDCVALS